MTIEIHQVFAYYLCTLYVTLFPNTRTEQNITEHSASLSNRTEQELCGGSTNVRERRGCMHPFFFNSYSERLCLRRKQKHELIQSR